MFRIPDLRNKILFTLFIIGVFRIGAHIPTPNVDFPKLQTLLSAAGQGNNLVGFIDLFSGGALTVLALFALGIMPYITSSIIMQLLGVVIPKIEQWREEGELGQQKITKWTRYLTVVLSLLQSTGIVFLAHNGQLIPASSGAAGGDLLVSFSGGRIVLMVMTLTAGTALVMWLGELITQRGIGNGMSLMIFVGILARLPSQFNAIFRNASIVKGAILAAIGVGMIVAIVFIEQGQRRIPVSFAKRVVGRRMYGGQSTYIPMKVNTAGVIPIIFASSVLYFPSLLATTLPFQGFRDFVQKHLISQSSFFYIAIYFTLIIFFSYFYTAIQFNPEQQADLIKKQGGFIPGYRPGYPTADYLNKVLTRITLPGSLYLGLVAIIPSLFIAFFGIRQFPFGGTAILIVVGVALETMKQIESQLMMRNYEGFLA
jgi:preprotein translocase subunit SecY